MASARRTVLKRVNRLASQSEAAHSRPPVPTGPLELAELVGLQLDHWQQQALTSRAAQLLLNCARQTGKSTVAALLATHKALTVAGSLTLIVGPSERQARECFQKCARFYKDLGYPVPADSDRKLGLELSTGSRIEALPGSEKTVRGFSAVDLLIIDEAARVSSELYYSVRPMLAVSGGRLLMMSTPYGRRGAFYQEWEDGGPQWERFEVLASECPRIPPEFLEAERSRLPEWVYRQEFECEFAEIEGQVFSHEMIQRAVSTEVEPIVFTSDAEEW